MEWYKTLNIHQKIYLKALCVDIIGFEFSDLDFMFSFCERINILYNKLKLEGFDI
jgi:hypothetical protein